MADIFSCKDYLKSNFSNACLNSGNFGCCPQCSCYSCEYDVEYQTGKQFEEIWRCDEYVNK